MQEMNLIDGEVGSESIGNNAPVVVNEIDINLLKIPSEDELSRELGCDCRMNKLITFDVKETSYKCPNCPNNLKHLCLYCLETCHKSHINNLPSYLFKGDLIDFQKHPCECAKNHHKTTVIKNIVQDNEAKINCPFNQIFGLIKPKYVYRRKENNKIYCMFCINNFTLPQHSTIIEEFSSSNKNSKLSPFGSMLKQSIEQIESEDRRSKSEKENVQDDENFFARYDKVIVDYSKPFPQCECVDDLHKHVITSENIENLCNYMINNVDKNKINLDKLSYQIFNNDLFSQLFFQKLVEIHENIFNLIKDIDIIDPSSFGNLADENNFTQIELDEKADWEIYHKSTKLIKIAAKRMKIFNFFGIKWLNEKYNKYFSFETLNKLLQCRSNIESNFFKLQLFTTKLYRQLTFKNIPHILLINENMSFINRQLFCSTGTTKTEEIFEQGKKIVEKIFYLLDFLIDNQNVSKEDYNELFTEALKILKAIIPFKANDVTGVMNLFRKIENNIGVVKSKKENQIKIVSTLQKIVEKIFSYFNDNKFVFCVKESEKVIKYDFSFLSSNPYNKELLSTLFNFDDIELNEMVPYINEDNFYDNLLSENDNYSENIENFLNADKKWLKRINKDFCYIFHGAERIEENEGILTFFENIVINIQNLMKNEIDGLQFLTQCREHLSTLALYIDTRDNNFKTQANFFQNKYFINFIFLISFLDRISTFEKNTEIEGTDERKKIDTVTKDSFDNINQILLLLTKENPMTASLLFSRIIISLLIRNDFDDLKIYIDVLKMMRRYKCKINTYFLTSHIHQIFKERMILKEDNINNIITLLNLYKIILKISSDNSMLKVNNIIAADLRVMIINQEFIDIFSSLDNETKINVVENVYKCIHLLQNEYFYIINQFIDIKSIIIKLKDVKLKPKTRKILTQIYTDYFFKNYFSTITIQKYFQNENLITSNLVENLSNSLEQRELQEYLNENEIKSQTSGRKVDKMNQILETILFNLEHYRCFDILFQEYFKDNFKVTVSFFKHIVLIPTAYSVYRLTYFLQDLTIYNQYDFYILTLLYHYCFQYFIETIIPRFDLNDEDKQEIWSNLFIDNVNIDKIKENLKESIKLLERKLEKNLKMNFLYNHFIKNSKCFVLLKENFFAKEEQENEEKEEQKEEEDNEFSVTFYNLSLDMNLFKKIKKELNIYKEQKSVFEGNNVFDDIFQDEKIEVVQKKIVEDLLLKLFFKKSKRVFSNQEHIEYSFQRDIVKGIENSQEQRKKSLFSGIYKGRRGAKSSFDPQFNDKTDKYGEYFNPYLSPFLEEKSLYFEIIDKCFKSNPSTWQELFVSMGQNGRDLIYNIIMKQLPFLLQFIFIEFNKIDKKETQFYQYFLNVLEFLRLLCEDHNPLFQTMFINYEKAIGKVSILTNDKNLFMPFISKIPIFVLLNIKYYNSKNFLREYFVQKDVEYFHPLVEKITDFLIEIIQGTYPENFNDLIKAVDEISNFGIETNIQKHNQYLDYLEQDLSYKSYITYFFKFLNCFIEEGANPLPIKVTIMNIFHPKQLLNISINSFKNCIFKYVGKTIKEGVADELIQVFKKDYDNIMNDTSFSLFLTLFLYIKRANSFQDKLLGDKYKKIIRNLKEISESDKVYEENSNFLLMKEYFKFCSTLILEIEIFFVKENTRDNKELFKYKEFFNTKYMEEVIEVRNKYFGNIQDIEKVFFLVHPDSLYIKQSDINLFLEKADYENFNTKLTCLLDYYPELNQLIEMRKTLSKNILALSQINYSILEWFNAVWAIVTNLLYIFSNTESLTYIFMLISAFGHISCLSLLVLNWFIFECIKKSKIKDFQFSIFFYLKLIVVSLVNKEILPFIWTLFFGVLGIMSEKTHFLLSVQLFPIFTLFEMMRNVLDAIQTRYKQFLSVAILIIILILFFSGITYYFFNYNSDGERLYTSYLNCFSYLINSGLRSGGLPFEIKIFGQEGFFGEFIYNWMFFLLFVLFIMNIAGGIIIDKFDELKDVKKKLYEEKENVCFICSLHRSNFEIKGIRFKDHQLQEHNIGNYFHYLMKINRIDEHDLNSIDFQVYNSFKSKKIVFFPIKKTKCLENL